MGDETAEPLLLHLLTSIFLNLSEFTVSVKRFNASSCPKVREFRVLCMVVASSFSCSNVCVLSSILYDEAGAPNMRDSATLIAGNCTNGYVQITPRP